MLSGGGARGFAHIGALKVLKENNVPIDYVVGTSMGSIIGGLYAIGLTPEEIERGVRGTAWDKVFDDFANRDYKSFRRKQDDYDFFNLQRIGIMGDGLQIRPGLIEGQQVELALDRLAHLGFHINDYDKLRIPFRAIATDIATGEPFIIKSGNIARAMRASMSIPGALPPITIDGSLLVDGGIANNVPIDIIRNMGADIVIVVDVSAPLSAKEEIKSAIDVTGQLTTILTRRIADIQIKTMKENDVLIIPGAKEISSSDFDKYPELIQAGYISATEEIDNLKKLSLSYEAYSSYISALPKVAIKQPIIEFIEIKNKTTLRDDVIRVRIHQKIGEPLDVAQLEEDISYIYGLDYSGSVVYSVERRDEKRGLIIYVRDREWAHSYIQFGLDIESAFEVISITNFSASYNKNNLNDLAGEFRAVGVLGSEPKLTAELYQPINIKLDTFVSLKTGFKTEIVPTLIGNHIESIQRINRTFITLSAGQLFLQNTSLSLGLSYNDGSINSVAGLKVLQPDFVESYYFVKLFHDSLDNLSFPNRGFFSSLRYTANREDLGADLNYEQIRLDISGATTFERYTIFARAVAETSSNEDNIPLNALFIHGGLFELSGTVRNELLSPHFGMLEAAFYRRLGDITFLPIYTGFSLEAGNAWDNKADIHSDNLRYAGSIFIGADTFMGPLYFSIGATDRGERAVYLNIGKTFLNN
ncbi:MAG: patatin-like phospholipase family protein [Gammaproteobacteria bacterium]|nr:patatin-like phospholipase family protein [Gammaproteobacteria bacterium]